MIEIKDLYKIYNSGDDEVRALDGVNITIEEGEFVAIMGTSGSGKSTLMNMLGCLDVPDGGSYHLCGQDVSSMSEKRLSRVRNEVIGFIFQSFNLIPCLNALENVELPLLYRDVSRQERRAASIEALLRVGLINRIKHCPSQMSGGQQQRVAIARAIASKPQLILADEPTGSLDSKSSADIMEILRELGNEGKTIVLITHDIASATAADRIITISDGRIVC
ncbi:MAG: ABC transporter ATP-binding protein [Oscillospiraceae bacterium]|nr:ABC transporter ATP-binding protein [Oscillospiraceae bacterium]